MICTKNSKTTKAILAYICSYSLWYEFIMDIAHENNAIVIEDAAQAMGAEYEGKKVGTV